MNPKGFYQNQCSIPKLALVQPSFEDDKYLCLNAPGMPTLKLDIHINEDGGHEKRMIKVCICILCLVYCVYYIMANSLLIGKSLLSIFSQTICYKR